MSCHQNRSCTQWHSVSYAVVNMTWLMYEWATDAEEAFKEDPDINPGTLIQSASSSSTSMSSTSSWKRRLHAVQAAQQATQEYKEAKIRRQEDRDGLLDCWRQDNFGRSFYTSLGKIGEAISRNLQITGQYRTLFRGLNYLQNSDTNFST